MRAGAHVGDTHHIVGELSKSRPTHLCRWDEVGICDVRWDEVGICDVDTGVSRWEGEWMGDSKQLSVA